MKGPKLNLGCGNDIRKDWVNLDKYDFPGINVKWDIDKTPFPLKKDYFSHILINHVLEHVKEIVPTLEEIWRISAPGAVVEIEVPYFSGLNAVGDPTHKHFFSYKTFDFFERNRLGKNNYFNGINSFNFKIIERKIIFSNNMILKRFNFLFNISPRVYERFFAYILPCQTIRAKLKVLK